MKITAVRSFFCGNNHYVRILTDEGISGVGEATLNTRQLGVEGVFRHLEPVLVGQDPFNIAHIWQDIYRCTFWRGGPVLLSALSGIDMALWDIKGKALGTPVYNLLGGKCRDRLLVYVHAGGKTPDDLCRDAEAKMNKGYRVLRICPHDAVEDGVYDQAAQVRRSVQYMKALRAAAGDELEIIFECHTRLSPAYATELCNAIAPYRPFFVEDPIRADSVEAFAPLRQHTAVALGTGEKLGAKWDYRYLIEHDMIDYVRSDICNCGGVTEMMKIAAFAEVHYAEMVPHGVPPVGYLAAMHCDFATSNFRCQEHWLPESCPAHLDYDVEFKDGYVTMGDRPGLGVEVFEDKCEPFEMREHPHWRRPDGSVQDW